MFKKKTKAPEDEESSCRTVVTETVETGDGLTKTTKTTVIKSSNVSEFESAFKDFKLDSNSMTTGKCVTKKVVRTSANGKTETIEELIEDSTMPANSSKDDRKQTKSLAERFGFKPKSKEQISDTKETKKPTQTVKPGKFEDECLKAHNDYRAKHGVPSLKLSKQLCGYSKEWADHLAATDSFQHRTERKYGENIYMKWSSDPNHTITGAEAVESWYSEIKDHTFGREPTSLKSGHFTQVVWKESTEMGVAWARSRSGKILVVANYNPAGNFVGRFTENVPPPKK